MVQVYGVRRRETENHPYTTTVCTICHENLEVATVSNNRYLVIPNNLQVGDVITNTLFEAGPMLTSEHGTAFIGRTPIETQPTPVSQERCRYSPDGQHKPLLIPQPGPH